MHKWLHYFPIYERHLRPFAGCQVVLLEIGVSHGGSLQVWRDYLGRRERIVGIDIEPRVVQLSEPGIDVIVGDQSDPQFLAELARQYGPFDIVIDDGSHQFAHQIASMELLWPHVADGGIYLVEDLHTSYFPAYGGRRGSSASFIAWVAQRIDDVHAFHSCEAGFEPNDWSRTVGGIQKYDSIAVFDKAVGKAPEHRKTGRPSFTDVYGSDVEAAIDEQHRQQLASLSSPSARLRRARRDPAGAARRAVDKLRRLRPGVR